MYRNPNRSLAKIARRTSLPLLAAGLLVGVGLPAIAAADTAVASQPDTVIVLPGAKSAEGIAAGAGSTFYAGDLYQGDIFRGDIHLGTAERFIDAPEGRMALGMKADLSHGLLFVAGGGTGQGYVYSTRTGAAVATYQFGVAGTSVINDVALAPGGVWFTDSVQAKLYFVPVSRGGTLGPVRVLDVTGPAAAITGRLNLNGIQATSDGQTLVVGHFSNQRIYTVNPNTGASALIEGIEVPNADGLVLQGRRLWVVQNFNNKIAQFQLSPDLTRGTLTEEITSPAFGVPTTAALFGNRLAAVNGHFNSSAPGTPPTSPTYEVVVVHA